MHLCVLFLMTTKYSYMNAIFQALFAIDGFRDLVIRPARRASLCTALDALFSNLSTTFLTLSAADPAELRQVIIEHQRNHKSTGTYATHGCRYRSMLR